jgi:hypothetical protein
MDEYQPTPAELPSALVDCPACGGQIHVSLSNRPPMAPPSLPGTQPPLVRPPKHCPLCGSRLWVRLRARAPVALPSQPKTTALIPKHRGNQKTTIRTGEEQPDPPPVT